MKQYPEDEKFRMRVHGFSETMLRVHTFPVALTTMMVNQLVTMCRCVVCLSAMKLSVMESSSTVNSRKQNLAFMTL
ncbi:primary repressor of lytic functions [Escherichia coli]|nr:primary repressor of lytic functions [Escherichia coli]